MTNLEVSYSVFKLIDFNKTYTKSTQGYWEDPEFYENLQDLIEQKNHVKLSYMWQKVNKRGLELTVRRNYHQLSDLQEPSKSFEFFKASKNMK